jgi:hypothetical protein
MDTGTAGLVAVLVGCLLAALLLWLGAVLLRLLRGVLGLLRMPRRRGAVLLARLRGLRLRRSRALARTEGERAAAAEAELRRLRVELRLVRAERDEALGRLSAGDAARRSVWPWNRAAAPDERFLRAKRAFAMRFHPDRLPRDATERAVRIALFREHWQELRRIERG